MRSCIVIAYDNPLRCCYFKGNYTDFKLVFQMSSVEEPQPLELTKLHFVIQLFSSNQANAMLFCSITE